MIDISIWNLIGTIIGIIIALATPIGFIFFIYYLIKKLIKYYKTGK